MSTGATRGIADSVAALESVRAARPVGAEICIIVDSLSARTGAGYPPLGEEEQGPD
ncbi:hypothetical protein [Streptomyces sp. MK37H]|uniref:hypothetical protein n=1 Tax=Streptomyces sp. MK37H TaxID=2699117 RepID=UPI001B380372|nr:hypothetical protein [Streptomyces sp. MK37H]